MPHAPTAQALDARRRDSERARPPCGSMILRTSVLGVSEPICKDFVRFTTCYSSPLAHWPAGSLDTTHFPGRTSAVMCTLPVILSTVLRMVTLSAWRALTAKAPSAVAILVTLVGVNSAAVCIPLRAASVATGALEAFGVESRAVASADATVALIISTVAAASAAAAAVLVVIICVAVAVVYGFAFMRPGRGSMIADF